MAAGQPSREGEMTCETCAFAFKQALRAALGWYVSKDTRRCS